jgi:hypothetical protein
MPFDIDPYDIPGFVAFAIILVVFGWKICGPLDD